MYCSCCQINWARLATDNEEDSSEVCPVCKTDLCLEEQKEGETFLMSPLNGEIKEIKTGRLLTKGLPPLPPVRKHRGLTKDQKIEKAELWEKTEEEAIDAYNQLFETNPEEAKKQYSIILASFDEKVKTIIIQKTKL